MSTKRSTLGRATRQSGERQARPRAHFVSVPTAAFVLLAVVACERLAGPDETARPPTSGPEAQAAVEAFGEDPHMVALAREIPGFGGYWYESPGGPLVVALTEAGAGRLPAARRAVLARRAADVRVSPSANEWIEPPPEVVERTVRTDVSIALGEIGRTVRRDRDCKKPGGDPSKKLCTTLVDSGDPTISIKSVRTGSDKNDILDKIGRTTGWTWGRVKETCKDVRAETGVVVECADEVDFVTGSGDSGAPVFN